MATLIPEKSSLSFYPTLLLHWIEKTILHYSVRFQKHMMRSCMLLPGVRKAPSRFHPQEAVSESALISLSSTCYVSGAEPCPWMILCKNSFEPAIDGLMKVLRTFLPPATKNGKSEAGQNLISKPRQILRVPTYDAKVIHELRVVRRRQP